MSRPLKALKGKNAAEIGSAAIKFNSFSIVELNDAVNVHRRYLTTFRRLILLSIVLLFDRGFLRL